MPNSVPAVPKAREPPCALSHASCRGMPCSNRITSETWPTPQASSVPQGALNWPLAGLCTRLASHTSMKYSSFARQHARRVQLLLPCVQEWRGTNTPAEPPCHLHAPSDTDSWPKHLEAEVCSTKQTQQTLATLLKALTWLSTREALRMARAIFPEACLGCKHAASKSGSACHITQMVQM